MQELLPLGVKTDLRLLLEASDAVIGQNLNIDAVINVHGKGAIMICGTVRGVLGPDAIVVVSPTGRITESLQVHQLILFGSIEPVGTARATVVSDQIITGKGSFMSNTDVLYRQMVTHPKGRMKKVHFDEIGDVPCAPRNI